MTKILPSQDPHQYELWRQRNSYFHEEDLKYLRFLISEDLKVLDLGCGGGDMLAGLKPKVGIGIDISKPLIKHAKKKYPHLTFYEGDIEHDLPQLLKKQTFDVILISDTVGSLKDIQNTFKALQPYCTPETRIIISYYSKYWEPVLKTAEALKLKMPTPAQNFLSSRDIMDFLKLEDFTPLKYEYRQLLPKKLFGIGALVNRFIATLPGIRRLCLRTYVVARSAVEAKSKKLPSISVVVPCKNEKGNIEPAIKRLPRFAPDMEIIFVDGHSQDGTYDEIKRVIKAYPQYDIKGFIQPKKGKGDAVHFAFKKARGDILMILDADLTTPPEDMPKFYEALVRGKGEFINGTRLIYPMEDQAMQFLNFLANKTFSWLFTYLLNQRLTDTLCGTKVLFKEDYEKIQKNRAFFGDFDPFGDFDLIFGASKLNLQIAEIPVHYAARTYGTTQISRFRHGFLLLQMVIFAFRKLKAF
jgi:ubiquinone/menaquinone biosynthesis C-methylase UbiE